MNHKLINTTGNKQAYWQQNEHMYICKRITEGKKTQRC